jgi:hypothetical protein
MTSEQLYKELLSVTALMHNVTNLDLLRTYYQYANSLWARLNALTMTNQAA